MTSGDRCIVSAQNINKNFGAKSVLRDIDFSIHAGEFVALLGPNGAGKTTLLSLITGLRRPSSGTLKIFDHNPWSEAARSRRGVTPQDLEFPPLLTVQELLKMVYALYSRRVHLGDHIDRMGLSHLLHKRCGSLSGGERRIVGLALALIGEPELIVLDEPTTGLDVEVRETLWRILQEEKKKGRAILLTSHDLSEVEILSERVLLLNQGKIVFAGGIEEILCQVPRQRVEFHSEWYEERFAGHTPLCTGTKRTFVTTDSDALIREVFYAKIPFSNLRIESAGLDEAMKKFKSEDPK